MPGYSFGLTRSWLTLLAVLLTHASVLRAVVFSLPALVSNWPFQSIAYILVLFIFHFSYD